MFNGKTRYKTVNIMWPSDKKKQVCLENTLERQRMKWLYMVIDGYMWDGWQF